MDAHFPARRVPVALAAALVLACAPATPPAAVPAPAVVPGATWRAEAPTGHAADAIRRNLEPGDGLAFHDLRLTVAEAGTPPTRSAADAERAVRLVLERGDRRSERWVAAGGAFQWAGYRVAVLAVRGPGELGAGLAELEVATVASIPPHIAVSGSAGGADMRLRVPHRITHVTLHHSGSSEPLRPTDDPVEKLRGLQRWGRTDRNWWDVPYHFLIDLDGRIYEGRDWRYMGETNTTYDPAGHLLISVIGNYNVQEATPAQIEAITDLMAWGVSRFDVPLERIGGHYDHAETSCPGTHLRSRLEDGTFLRGVEARLRAAGEDPSHLYDGNDP